MNPSENPVVRLEIFECFRSVIQTNTTQFKLDGITKEQLIEVCDKIYDSLDEFNLNQETVRVKVSHIMELETSTYESIENAYLT